MGGRTKSLATLVALALSLGFAAPALAAGCAYATSQGQTGPASWQTYCWIDFASYNNALATSAGGQNFRIVLQDGSTVAFNIQVSSPSPLIAIAVPSWTGSAFGNSAFLGIGGKAVLYQTGSGDTSQVTFSNIRVSPPIGVAAATSLTFVAGDGESTNGGEALNFQTNGGAWTQLDGAGPITGSIYPTVTGVGTASVTNVGVTGGYTGAYIFGTTSPTRFVATMFGGGLQGMVFAIRYATLRLTTVINGTRVSAADQFFYSVNNSSGTALGTGTSSGTGLGPFTAAPLSAASGVAMTLTEAMAAGSANAISHYQSSLTCANANPSSTVMPTNAITTAYNFGSLQFGDSVFCTYTETPFPHLTFTKALGSNGRLNATDQFTLNILNGAAPVASTTTTGTGTMVSNASTAQTQVTAGTTYSFVETGAGSTPLARYSPALACTNANATSTTALPTAPGGSLKPAMGDVVACTLTNTLVTSNAALTILKTASVLSDPIDGAANPKAIPGAIVQYTLLLSNTGTGPADANSLFLVDKLPPQVAVGTSAKPVFTDGTPSSGLTMAAPNVKYSSAAAAPTSLAACNYTPTSAYDSAVKYICFNPQGTMQGFSTAAPNFAISFQSQLQ